MEIKKEQLNDMVEYFCPDISGRVLCVRAKRSDKIKLDLFQEKYLSVVNCFNNSDMVVAEYEPDFGKRDFRSMLVQKVDALQKLGIRTTVFCDLKLRLFYPKDNHCSEFLIKNQAYTAYADFEQTVLKECGARGVDISFSKVENDIVTFRLSGDIVIVCDEIVLVKVIAKRVASARGIGLTFMPKPFFDEKRCGLTLAIELISDSVQSFCEGVILHSPEILCGACSTVNSFLSLQDFSPYLFYGADESVIKCKADSSKALIKLEYCDLLCNPYIAFTFILQGGIMGVENGCALRDEVKEITPSEQKDCERLPSSLADSVEIAFSSGFLSFALGESGARDFYNLITARCKELDQNSGEDEHQLAYFDFF